MYNQTHIYIYTDKRGYKYILYIYVGWSKWSIDPSLERI